MGRKQIPRHTRRPRLPRAAKRSSAKRRRAANAFRWPPALLALLGQIPDILVAEKAGISVSTVKRERRQRGIAAPPRRRPPIEWRVPVGRLEREERARAHFPWTKNKLALLGKLPDDVVGARIGLNRQSVAAERRRRGIPPARPRRPPVEWTAEMLSLLGSDSDRAVAEMLGLNTASVVRKRQELKIPPFYPSHGKHRKFPWRPEDLALLGKVSDGDLARRLGLTRTSVTCKRQGLGIAPLCPRARVIEWTPAMLERLGKAADWQIAEELGVASATIHKKRHELGILATKEVRPIRQNAAAAEILRLPTHEIKRLEGIDRTTIARLRRDLGVEEPLFRPPFAIAGSGRKARGSAAVGERAVYAWRHRCRWQPEEIALLGTAPDSEVARQVGRSALAVLTKRLALGMRVGRRFWQPEEIALLGTAMDKQVAARLGRSTRAVLTKRLALGIPAFDQAHSRQVAPKSRRLYQKRIKARKA